MQNKEKFEIFIDEKDIHKNKRIQIFIFIKANP
ncbi:Hypothetical protein KK9_2017 (plasmid) [Borreliella garinii BgVir]|nr:Hypothetical protein KK9_2017 [Borreliella garinii BgVir]